MQRAYTSTVMGPAHLAAGVAGAAAFGGGTAAAGWPAWVTVLGVTAVVIAAIHVSVVRLSIGAGRIVVGRGPWSRRARVIPAETVSNGPSRPWFGPSASVTDCARRPGKAGPSS